MGRADQPGLRRLEPGPPRVQLKGQPRPGRWCSTAAGRARRGPATIRRATRWLRRCWPGPLRRWRRCSHSPAGRVRSREVAVGLLDHHGIAAHGHLLSPAWRLMEASVPGASSCPMFPGTVTVPGLVGWRYWRWPPTWRSRRSRPAPVPGSPRGPSSRVVTRGAVRHKRFANDVARLSWPVWADIPGPDNGPTRIDHPVSPGSVGSGKRVLCSS
jgi:hypothetical protein